MNENSKISVPSEPLQEKGDAPGRDNSRMFRNAFLFRGRCRRLEYWLVRLLSYPVFLGLLALGLWLEDSCDMDVFGACITFVCTISYLWLILSEGVRRSHDVGCSGFYLLIPFYVLYLLFVEGDSGDNAYGTAPKAKSKQRLDVKEPEGDSPVFPWVLGGTACILVIAIAVALALSRSKETDGLDSDVAESIAMLQRYASEVSVPVELEHSTILSAKVDTAEKCFDYVCRLKDCKNMKVQEKMWEEEGRYSALVNFVSGSEANEELKFLNSLIVSGFSNRLLFVDVDGNLIGQFVYYSPESLLRMKEFAENSRNYAVDEIAGLYLNLQNRLYPTPVDDCMEIIGIIDETSDDGRYFVYRSHLRNTRISLESIRSRTGVVHSNFEGVIKNDKAFIRTLINCHLTHMGIKFRVIDMHYRDSCDVVFEYGTISHLASDAYDAYLGTGSSIVSL